MSEEVRKEKHTKKSKFISVPLFKQSFKSLWVLWLALTIGSAFIFVVINIAIGSKNIFTNIDMDSVSTYVKDDDIHRKDG